MLVGQEEGVGKLVAILSGSCQREDLLRKEYRRVYHAIGKAVAVVLLDLGYIVHYVLLLPLPLLLL
jgi:hypothetical protein